MPVKHLLKSLKVGDVTLNNRIALAPLTRGRATEDHVPTEIMVDYYRQRASGGLLITEATGISQQGLGWFHAPGVWNEKQVEAWKPVTKAVHAEGGAIAMQLWHMGRQVSETVTGMRAVAPSPIGIPGEVTAKNGEKEPYATPEELSEEAIQGIVQDYKKAAKNAIEAGFDLVEIHGANGYLVDLFLQSATNQRTDKYGGSIENRLRFMKEIIQAIGEEVPLSKVGIRLSPNGAFGGMGSADNNETFTEAIAYVCSEGLGFVHVLTGLTFGFHEKSDPFTLEMAREIVDKSSKSEKTALVVNVGYTKETGEEAVASGGADIVAYGRPYISNPDLVERFTNDYPLAEDAPYPTWWGNQTAQGYTDFPTYKESQVESKN